jgi:hypothetical protein
MGRKVRPGFTKLPRGVLQDARLKLEHIGLLLELKSHAPTWVHKLPMLQERFSIGEAKLGRLLKELESWGYITRKKAIDKKGWIQGIFVTVHDVVPILEKEGLDKKSNTQKTKLGKSRVHKESNTEGHSDFDVIDDGDVAGTQHPSLRVIAGGGSCG